MARPAPTLQLQPGMAVDYLSHGLADHPHYVAYVVVGDGPVAGHIKSVRIAPNMGAGIVRVDWLRRPGQPPVFRGMSIDYPYQRRGWRFLSELYAEEGRPEMYDVWLSYQKAILSGHDVSEFNDSYLPKKVIELRNGGAKSIKWTPNVPTGEADTTEPTSSTSSYSKSGATKARTAP